MTQEYNFIQPEFTLGEFSIEFLHTQPLQDLAQMRLVLLLILRINQYIVDEDNDKLV